MLSQAIVRARSPTCAMTERWTSGQFVVAQKRDQRLTPGQHNHLAASLKGTVDDSVHAVEVDGPVAVKLRRQRIDRAAQQGAYFFAVPHSRSLRADPTKAPEPPITSIGNRAPQFVQLGEVKAARWSSERVVRPRPGIGAWHSTNSARASPDRLRPSRARFEASWKTRRC